MMPRLSENVVAGLVGAAALAVLTTGTAVAVTASRTVIVDAGSGAKARVTAKNSVATSERDPVTGIWGRLDSHGRTLVRAADPLASAPHAITLTGGVSSGLYLGEVMSDPLTRDFVIQSVSGYIEVDNGITPTVTLLVYQNPSPASWTAIDVPLMYKSKNGTSDHYQFAMALPAFARSGSRIIVDTSRNDATGPESYRLSLVGYDA